MDAPAEAARFMTAVASEEIPLDTAKNLIMALLPLHALAMIFMSVFVLTGTPESNHQCKINNFRFFKK